MTKSGAEAHHVAGIALLASIRVATLRAIACECPPAGGREASDQIPLTSANFRPPLDEFRSLPSRRQLENWPKLNKSSLAHELQDPFSTLFIDNF